MHTNIHYIERILRIVLGLSLLSLAFWGPSNLLFLIGIIPLVTGLHGWCPLYALLGVSTYQKNIHAPNNSLSRK